MPFIRNASRPAIAVAVLFALVLFGCDDGKSTTPPGGADADTVTDGAELDGLDGATPDVPVDGTDTDGPTLVGDGTDQDAGDVPVGCPGGAGCECKADADCQAGVCAWQKDGSRTCAAECVLGDTCATGACVSHGGKDYCLDAAAYLCNPCSTNADCAAPGSQGAACVDHGDAGSFCGTACTGDGDCEVGYACQDAKDVDGKDVKQCRPKDGAVCSCSPLAIALQAKTACSSTNAAGSCAGERACLAKGQPGAPAEGGLSACSAATPAAESCNGQDDDCDGVIDGAAACDDGNPCTADACDPASGCTSTNDDAATCTDNDACTTDKCAAGQCESAKTTCDDANPCTDDSCDIATGCTATADDSNGYDDGNACTTDSCVAGVPTSATVTCDDANPCTDDSCDLATGCTTTNDDSNPCSDGDACTDDACAVGLCASVTAAACDDGSVCTKDSCDPATGCVFLADDVTLCDDANPCTTDSCDPKLGCQYKPVAGCALPLPYTQGFACSPKTLTAWTFDAAYPNGLGWAVDATANPPGFHSPDCSLNFNDGKNFICPAGETKIGPKYATGPLLDASALKAGALLTARFRLAGDWESGSWDDVLLEASTDDVEWKLVASYDDPGDGVWKLVDQGLTDYAGKKFRLRFAFFTKDCFSNAGEGAYVDDLKVFDATCGKDTDCDDENPCTDNVCDAATGVCKYTNTTAVCDDGNPCTKDDVCGAGKCTGKVKCDDGDSCTADLCDAKTGDCSTTAKADSSTCTDGNACTTGDTCYGGKCIAKPKCDDGNPCTLDTCTTSGTCGATPLPDAATCTDGDPCTGNDTCTQATCTGTPQPCSVLASDAFACDSQDWVAVPADVTPAWAIDGTPLPPAYRSPACSLNFNNAKDFVCPSGEKKSAGTATSKAFDLTGAKQARLSFWSWADVSTGDTSDFRWVEVSTDDFKTVAKQFWIDNSSTIDEKWIHEELDLSAFAGQAIKIRFHFDSGDCAFNTGKGWFIDDLQLVTDVAKPCADAAACNDGNPCTDDACEQGKCVAKYNTAPCDDGQACTTGETCSGGACQNGKADTCDDGNPCTTDSCDVATGCKHVEKADNASCSDGEACTTSDKCQSGKCVGTPKADDSSCSDGDSCTTGDKCQAGKCTPTGPAADGTTCSDSDPCTTSDKCTAGKCGGTGANPCDDGNACTADVCTKTSSTAKTCTNAPMPAGSECEDGDICTPQSGCQAGKCVGTGNVCSKVLEDVFDCAKPLGWTLDAPVDSVGWKIDGLPDPPAFKSPSCSLNFNNDKDYDNDEQVKGNAVSPTLTVPAKGKAALSFWSYHGVEEDAGYDFRYVDVSDDGFASNVETWLLNNELAESVGKWTQVQIPLVKWVGKSVQVRFRFDSKDSFANSTPGWFVDDVALLVAPEIVGCKIDADCQGDPCQTGTCTDGKCAFAPKTGPCDDLNACTEGTTCDQGQCQGGGPVDCDDKNVCTKDACDGLKGCTHTPVAGCALPLPYISSFSCGGLGSKQWQLSTAAAGPAWGFDATPSVPGFQSPDCSLNFNDGTNYVCADGQDDVQGTATSPVLDGSGFAPGTPLVALFSLAGKWENGKFDNLDLEASTDGGATWKVVATYDPPGSGWQKHKADLAAYAGSKFALRFRFWTEDCFANSTAGAFVDDLQVSDATCKADADCGDDNACTDDKCDVATGKCSNPNNILPCDDGNACTSGDTCGAGKCTGAAKACDDKNGCTNDACDTKTGACVFTPKADNSFCSDANSCTTGDTCKAGQCTSTGTAADGAFCSDSNSCTTGDACLAGKCTPKGNATDGASCSDSNPCTTGDACMAGKCMGPKAACDDGKACTVDVCTAISSFSKTCDVQPDTDKCMFVTGFSDPFDCGKSNGWLLDPVADGVGWAIDGTPEVPGAKSPACSLNINDGTGYANGKQVAANAVSAEIDLPPFVTYVALSFWSYSGVQENSFDKRKVEVLADGGVVQTITVANSADLNKWVLIKTDLSQHAGKKIKLRFNFDTGDETSNNGPGWFVDDVEVLLAKEGKVAQVKTENFQFVPDTVTIKAGEAVEFTTEAIHSAVEVGQSDWEQNKLVPKQGGVIDVGFGAKQIVPFPVAGTYYYMCDPHGPGGMKGKVIVE